VCATVHLLFDQLCAVRYFFAVIRNLNLNLLLNALLLTGAAVGF
jgi:hypothetical protein